MARYINIGDNKGRNAEIVFAGKTKKPFVKQVSDKGEPVQTIRVLKGVTENSYDYLIKAKGTDEAVAQSILSGDADISLHYTGRFISSTSKLYIDDHSRPVFWVNKKERVFMPDGTLKEERELKETMANILSEHPIRPIGKLLSRKEMAAKLVFAKKYQLSHVNGLTFDFLMDIAKELAEKDSLLMIGGGPNGKEPLVFQEGGKGYRAFLEGRVNQDGYILIMHLSNLELKGVN